MDNLAAHKGQRIKELIEERGCEFMHLPPYSLDLNPIEEGFSKVKQLLRETEARTCKGLIWAMGVTISAVTAQGTHGIFEHCWYRILIQPLYYRSAVIIERRLKGRSATYLKGTSPSSTTLNLRFIRPKSYTLIGPLAGAPSPGTLPHLRCKGDDRTEVSQNTNTGPPASGWSQEQVNQRIRMN